MPIHILDVLEPMTRASRALAENSRQTIQTTDAPKRPGLIRSDAYRQLEHELADCLWSLLVLAKRLDVDLAGAFDATMTELTAVLDAQ